MRLAQKNTCNELIDFDICQQMIPTKVELHDINLLFQSNKFEMLNLGIRELAQKC